MVAPLLDQASSSRYDGDELPLRPNIGLYTQPITLIGLPVVAAPVHAGRMPTDGRAADRSGHGSEEQLLRVARELEARAVCTAPVAP